MILTISILIAIAIIIIIIYKKYEKFVFKHSVALQKLNEINNKYEFNQINSYPIANKYDNEKYFEMISTEDYLIYNLQFIKEEVKNDIGLVVENQNLWDKYKEEITDNINYGEFDVKPLKFTKLLLHIEYKLLCKYAEDPILDFKIKVFLYLTNMEGNVLISKSQVFDIDEIEELIFRIQDKTGDRFNDKEIWNSIARVEKGKVTNHIRFLVYKRDGYRCCKCGETDDLQIDHIIPISKGGKSELDNLQTLCKYCNIKKSNIIEPGTFQKSKKYNRFCPHCGAPMQLRKGPTGEFYGCMNYPKCKYTYRK